MKRAITITVIVLLALVSRGWAQSTTIFDGTLVNTTWPEVKKAAAESALVLLPIGVIEQHGPHICLGTDTYMAYQTSIHLRKILDSAGVKSVIAPPLYWGIMQLDESGAFPGSFTVSPSTMKALLTDVFTDLQRWGFKYIYCVNHHGDRLHRKTYKEAIAEAKEKLGLVFYNDQEEKDRDQEPSPAPFITGTLADPDYHSGAPETAIMLEYYPKLVDIDVAKSLKPETTWQPLGYVGDPANYKNIDMKGYDRVEVAYYAKCIAHWYREQTGKPQFIR